MVTYWLLGRTGNSDSNLRGYNNGPAPGGAEDSNRSEENRILPVMTIKAADAPPYNAPAGITVQAGGKVIQQGGNMYSQTQNIHQLKQGGLQVPFADAVEIGETTITSDIAVPVPKMPSAEPPSYEQLEAELAKEGTKSPPIVQLVEGYHY